MNNIKRQEIKTAKAYDRYARLTNSGGAIETNKDMRDIRKSLKGIYNMSVMCNDAKLSYFEFLKKEQAYWNYSIDSYLEYQQSLIKQSQDSIIREACDALVDSMEDI